MAKKKKNTREKMEMILTVPKTIPEEIPKNVPLETFHPIPRGLKKAR